MTDWIYRYLFIVPDSVRGQANAYAKAIMGRNEDEDTYIVGLSADGSAPATHWACGTAATESHRQVMAGILASGGFPVTYWRLDNLTGLLQATNHAGSEASIGAVWTFEDSLSALGLARIHSVPPGEP